MKKEIVAIQGELGAYSHLAAINFFKNPEIRTCTTFEEAFQTAFHPHFYACKTHFKNLCTASLMGSTRQIRRNQKI